MARYPILPEDLVLTEWYAGASLTFDQPMALVENGDWSPGDATVAFTDIGLTGVGPRAQIVVYVVDHGLGATLKAASAEIDPADARRIARALLKWAKEAERV